MKSRSRIFGILLLVLLLSACFTVFAACKGNVPTVPSVVKPTTKQVSVAMTEVYQAITASNHAQGVTEFTLGFDGEYSGEKSFTYRFAANFDIGAANLSQDTASELSFILSEEAGDILGIFYKAGYLYIDYPPLIEKGKFSGTSLAPIAKSFYDANVPGGKINTLADLIPTIGNYIFSDCVYSRDNNVALYNFTVSFQSFFNSIATIMRLADIGVGESELIQVLGLTAADIYALQNGGIGNVKITTVATGGVAVFDKAELSSAYTVGAVNERHGFALKNFVLKNGASSIAMPTNLASAYSYYSLGNLDFAGSIVIDTVNSATTTVFGVSDVLKAELSTAQYTYHYRLKSNVTAEGEVTAYFELDIDEERTLEFYFAGGILYMDLSDIGLGTLLTSADWIEDTLHGFNLLTDKEALSLNDKIMLFAELLGGRDVSGSTTTYTLGKDCVQMLLSALGYDSIFEYDAVALSVNTANNRLQNITAKVEAFGITATLSAASPKIGNAVNIARPSWTSSCVDITIAERFTPVITGTISSNTLAGDDVALLEKFVESLTGESIEFDVASRRNIIYTAAANIDNAGAIIALKVDFKTSTYSDICTFVYTDEAPDKFYVIYPLTDGINPVRTFTIKSSERYSLFMQAINGNAVAEYGESFFALDNGESNWKLAASRGALNNLLGAVARVFSGSSFPSIPSDFAILSMQADFASDGISTRVNFAGNSYIDINIDSVSLDYFDVGIIYLDVNSRKVSIYQNNNMESNAAVAFGDGTSAALSMLDQSGQSLWRYSSIPTVGSGTVSVDASVTLLGRTFKKNIQVDTSSFIPIDTSINEVNSAYFDSDDKQFSFSRYNCNDNPIDIITAFNRATISTSLLSITNKEVRWQCNGDDIRTHGLNSLENSTFNIVPVVKSFFGTDIGLYPSGTYSVVVLGAKATGINNSDAYKTITAYDGSDPYDESTYAGAEAMLADSTSLSIEALRFDISSIRADVINNLEYLAGDFYKAEGTYLIDAVVADCMGRETRFPVKITVLPRVITSVEFGIYSDGVSFEGRAVGSDRIIGSFTFDPMTVTSLSASSVYARIALCNGGEFTLSSLKWEFAPVASIDLFAGLEGEMSLVIGTEAGGFQTFKVLYAFRAIEVTEVALADEDGNILVLDGAEQRLEVADAAVSVSFSLLGLDPYDYTYPAKVIFYYQDGERVFDADWAFDWEENRLWNRGESFKYSSQFAKTSLKVNLEMSFKSRIVKAYKFVENPQAQDSIFIRAITVGEAQENVYLEYKMLDNQKRLIFVSYGPFDQDNESILDYRDIANYPQKAFVQFLNDQEEEWHEMQINWNIDAYSSPNEVMQYGYSGSIGATIAYGQSIGNVYVSVAASVPDEVFVVYSDGGLVTDKKINLSILSVQDSELITIDPTDALNFPKQLYLSYEIIQSGWFEVSEWVLTDAAGRNIIEEFYKSALATGTALENISSDGIAVKARFGSELTGYIDILVEVAINASVMTDKTLSGIPLVNSSITGGGLSQNSMIYSVDGETLRLTVDPYVANPRSIACYPTELVFVLNGDAIRRLNIDSWELSAVPATNLHLGGVYEVVAQIDVGMEHMIEVPVQLVIKERVIEKIWVDGSSAGAIYIDPYSLQPFGENVEGDYAYKTVAVKFFGDDNTYVMVMEYNISGINVSYTGGIADYNVTVRVGNEAGGYQAISGYNVYVKQSLVVSVETDAVAEGANDPIGEIYKVTDNGGTFEEWFKALDSDELTAIFGDGETPNRLTIKFGTPSDITNTRLVSENDGITEGLVYEWKRTSEGELYLELWNNNPLYGDRLGNNQIIETGLINYVEVRHNLFDPTLILPEDGYSETYEGKTVGEFLDAHPLASEHFTPEQIVVTLVRSLDDYEMQEDEELSASEYYYVITVIGHRKYGGSLSLTININPIEIQSTDFNVTLDGIAISLDYSSMVYNGNAVELGVAVADGIPPVLTIEYDGFTGNPKNVGIYNYDLVSSDSNYSINFNGVFEITAATITGSNSEISVGDGTTVVPPAISVRVGGIVLTTENYSVYYGSEETPESINIDDYSDFVDGYDFAPDSDSGTAYVKIAIHLDNYEPASFVRSFVLSRAQID